MATQIGMYRSIDLSLDFMRLSEEVVYASKVGSGEVLEVESPLREVPYRFPVLSMVEKVQRLLKNQHFFPKISEGKVHFVRVNPSKKSWSLVAHHTHPLSSGCSWVGQSNGIIRYIVGSCVVEWNWRTNTTKSIPYSHDLQSIVELPDGRLVVLDCCGELYLHPNTRLPTTMVGIGDVEPLSAQLLLLATYDSYYVYSIGNESSVEIKDARAVFPFREKVLILKKDGQLSVKHYNGAREVDKPFEVEFSEGCENQKICKVVQIKNSGSLMLVFWEGADEKGCLCQLKWESDKLVLNVIGEGYEDVNEPVDYFWDGSHVTYALKDDRSIRRVNCDGKRSDTDALGKFPIGVIGRLSDGSTLVSISNQSVELLDREMKQIWSQPDYSKGRSIQEFRELDDGSVVIVADQFFKVLQPEIVEEESVAYIIKRLVQEIKVHPSNLALYHQLRAIPEYKNQQNVLEAGLSAAMRAGNGSEVRKFYEWAKLDGNKEFLARRVHQWATDHGFTKLRRRTALDVYELTQDASLLEQGTKSKKRLLIGEGDFAFAEALTKKRRTTHPDLPSSIVATELLMPSDTTQKCQHLMKAGMTIRYGIDATKVGEEFAGQRFKRIHWNCPYGGSLANSDEFKNVVPTFFVSAAKLQKPGDQIHITLMNDKPAERQRNVRLVVGATAAGYSLFRKRSFTPKRFPGYLHTKTNGGVYTGKSDMREYVFRKSGKKVNLRYPTYETAKALKDSTLKDYTIQPENGELTYSHFECSTDYDSSDYYDTGNES